MPWTPDVYQSRSQSFVPLDQRSENESSRSIHFEITMGNNRILVIRLTGQSQSATISCYGTCDRAEKRLRMRHWRPSRPISFEIAQSARHLARKYRLEQHIPNERPSSLLTSQ